MDRQAASILGPYLARDEALLWSGRPHALHYALAGIGWRFRAAVAALVVILALAAAFWVAVIPLPQSLFYRAAVALLVLSVLVVVLRVLAMPLERYFEARQVAYGLTERRALIIVEGSRSRIEEFPLSALEKAHRADINASLATIHLGNTGKQGGDCRRSFVEARSRVFIAVRGADALMERLKELDSRRSAQKSDPRI